MVLMIGLLVSCGNENKKNEPEVKTVDTKTEIHESVPTNAKFEDRALANTYDNYIDLKSSLVNSDMEKAQKSAKNLAKSLEEIDASREMKENAIKISEVSDIEAQREVFQFLTEDMIKLVKGNFSDGNVYVQFCPMAFGGKGAYWLSNGKDILNPYYGDKMLKCGEVKEVLK